MTTTRHHVELPARTRAMLAALPSAPKGWKPPRTQAEFDTLLAHAEQDLATVRFPVPRRGRPAAGEVRTSVAAAIRLPRPLMDALTTRAKRRKLSVNAAIREAVLAWTTSP